MRLLSKISGNRIVGILRDKKEDALRGEAYAWVLVLRTFDELREVGVLSYLKLHFI